MKDKDLFLFDSSIWVEIERGNASIIEMASPLIHANRVCLCDLIVAELLKGARTEADYKGLKLRLESFPMYSTDWRSVAWLAFRVAKRGYSPPLSDLYIADCAISFRKTLVTRDRHFKQISQVKKFNVEFW